MNALPDTSTVSDTRKPPHCGKRWSPNYAQATTCAAHPITRALAEVPRHVFALEEPLERAYATQTVLQSKRDERGVATSMISAADIQAMMLEQAQLAPGMRVLEIGSGGYNAALIAELFGDTGQVTTIDIDPGVIEHTRRCLGTAGYGRQVQVVVADAAEGRAAWATYDCIIATTSTSDIPPAWRKQLAEGGRLVVPLRMRGLTRSVAFERHGDRLASTGYELCSFVPMQGSASPDEQWLSLDADDVGLRIDGTHPVDVERLRQALSQHRQEAWSSVTATGGRFEGLHLWLALNLPQFGVLTASKDAAARGTVAHAWALGIPTALTDTSFAYLGLRPLTPDRSRCEFGVYGHGPDAEDLMHQMLQHIRSWDGRNLDAHIEAFPASTPQDKLWHRGPIRSAGQRNRDLATRVHRRGSLAHRL